MRCRALCRPSSTAGHFHLFIDSPLTWGAYAGLLRALVSAEFVEPGYSEASNRRKQTFVRLRPNKRDCEQAWATPVERDPKEPW